MRKEEEKGGFKDDNYSRRGGSRVGSGRKHAAHKRVVISIRVLPSIVRYLSRFKNRSSYIEQLIVNDKFEKED